MCLYVYLHAYMHVLYEHNCMHDAELGRVQNPVTGNEVGVPLPSQERCYKPML